LDTGSYVLITEPFAASNLDQASSKPFGRTAVQAAQIGPFARVVNTGSCLHVRAEPSLAGQSLDCMADGVLLRDTGETRDADGVTWVSVMTPGGVQGWSASGFLER
jgi:hypothetical protein